MLIASLSFSLLLALAILALALSYRRFKRSIDARMNAVVERVGAIDSEASSRLDIIDDQITDIGGSVVLLQRLVDGNRNQGFRSIDHDYNNVPFEPFFRLLNVDEKPRRSGEMYLTHPELLKPGTPVPPELIPPPVLYTRNFDGEDD